MTNKTQCVRCHRVVEWTKDWLRDSEGVWHWGCAPTASKSFFYDKVPPKKRDHRKKRRK